MHAAIVACLVTCMVCGAAAATNRPLIQPVQVAPGVAPPGSTMVCQLRIDAIEDSPHAIGAFDAVTGKLLFSIQKGARLAEKLCLTAPDHHDIDIVGLPKT